MSLEAHDTIIPELHKTGDKDHEDALVRRQRFHHPLDPNPTTAAT
jgi:hypothetical protein